MGNRAFDDLGRRRPRLQHRAAGRSRADGRRHPVRRLAPGAAGGAAGAPGRRSGPRRGDRRAPGARGHPRPHRFARPLVLRDIRADRRAAPRQPVRAAPPRLPGRSLPPPRRTRVAAHPVGLRPGVRRVRHARQRDRRRIDARRPALPPGGCRARGGGRTRSDLAPDPECGRADAARPQPARDRHRGQRRSQRRPRRPRRARRRAPGRGTPARRRGHRARARGAHQGDCSARAPRTRRLGLLPPRAPSRSPDRDRGDRRGARRLRGRRPRRAPGARRQPHAHEPGVALADRPSAAPRPRAPLGRGRARRDLARRVRDRVDPRGRRSRTPRRVATASRRRARSRRRAHPHQLPRRRHLHLALVRDVGAPGCVPGPPPGHARARRGDRCTPHRGLRRQSTARCRVRWVRVGGGSARTSARSSSWSRSSSSPCDRRPIRSLRRPRQLRIPPGGRRRGRSRPRRGDDGRHAGRRRPPTRSPARPRAARDGAHPRRGRNHRGLGVGPGRSQRARRHRGAVLRLAPPPVVGAVRGRADRVPGRRRVRLLDRDMVRAAGVDLRDRQRRPQRGARVGPDGGAAAAVGSSDLAVGRRRPTRALRVPQLGHPRDDPGDRRPPRVRG